MSFNLYLFEKINGLAFRFCLLDGLMVFFARYCEWFLLFFLVLFLLKERRRFFSLFLGFALSGFISRLVITESIRHFFPVDRPFVNYQVNLLLHHAATPSFPSGHAAFYFALAFYVFFINKKAGTFFLLGALLISFARVFVGIHWPLDILVGMAVGILSAVLIYWLQNRLQKKFSPSSFLKN